MPGQIRLCPAAALHWPQAFLGLSTTRLISQLSSSSRNKQLTPFSRMLLVLLLLYGVSAIPPEDPDASQTVTQIATLCGSSKLSVMLPNIRGLRSALLFEGYQYEDTLVGSIDGVHAFSNGSCDALFALGALGSPHFEAITGPLGLQRTVLQMPFAAGAIVITHNVPGLDNGELLLNADVLAGIYQCAITSWSDQRLAALNPGIWLPSERIIPVALPSDQPETLVFTQYLSLLSAAWPHGIRYNMAATSPKCVVTETVAGQQTGYMLRYLTSQPFKAPWTTASLQNRAGKIVRPSSDLPHLPNMHLPASSADWSSFSLASTDHPEAYPLAYLYFVIVDANSSDRGFPAGKQIQNVARVLLSEPVQEQIQNDDLHLNISRLHLNSSVAANFEADMAAMVVMQTSPDDIQPKVCQVCGSQAHVQLVGDARQHQSAMPFSSIYTYFSRVSKAIDYFNSGNCHMMLLDQSLTFSGFQALQRVGQQIVQVPFARRKLLVVHTIPGVNDDELRLDADILVRIFQCNITVWDHPDIQALNENVTLPSAEINVMLQNSSQALFSTYNRFIDALSSNLSAARVDLTVAPCVSYFTNNTRLQETRFALGLTFNKTFNMKASLIENRAGAWVSGMSGADSMPADIWLPSADEPMLWRNVTLAASGADDAYPLTSLSFMVWDLNSTSAGYPAGEQLRSLSSALLSENFQKTLPKYLFSPLGIDGSDQLQSYRTTIQNTLAAKPIEFIPAGHPLKSNWSIQGACSDACGITCILMVSEVNFEISSGRPFQVLTNLGSDQEAVERLLDSNADLDFVLSHAPASEQALDSSRRRIIHIPFGFYPLAVFHNIPGIASGALNLDAHALARLYTCKSVTVDDYIRSLNPTLRLPSVSITPLAFPRSASASELLIAYMAQDAAWDGEARSMKDWPGCVKIAVDGVLSASMGQLLRLGDDQISIGYSYTDTYAMFLRLQAGLKSTDGKLDREPTVASVLNKDGVFMSPIPTSNISCPYNASTLPDTITSPKWGQIPHTKDIPGVYPVGSLIYMIADQNIGATGTYRAKRLRSFMRTLLTEKYTAPAKELTGSRERHFVPLSPAMVQWALNQVANLSVLPIPPKPLAALPKSPTDYEIEQEKERQRTRTLTLALSVAFAGVALVGIAVAVILIYMRTSGSTTVTSKMMLVSATESGFESSHEPLKLMLNSQGNPVELGSGTYGKVFKGRWRGVLVAVKVLHKASDEHQEELLREAAILRRLRHPNVVNFLGLGTNGSDQVMMITEFMQGGDLRKALDQDSSSMGWYKKGRSVALGLAQSLAYLHSQSVISFDVKPENVLLDPTMTIARLTDVGLAKVLEGSYTNTMGRGTFDYMAPELFGSYELESDGQPQSGEYRPEVTYAVDIYSFGCVLWEIVTGERMQRSESSLREPRVPEECPSSIAELLKSCLSHDLKQRPCALDVVSAIACAFTINKAC